MAPFNWFNRQFNDSSDSQKAEEADTPPVPAEEAEQPADEATDSPPAVNQDYLTWAKAAYANIQKQRQAESTPDQAETATTTETATPEATPEIVAPEAAAPEVAPEVAPEEVQPVVPAESSAAALADSAPESVAELPVETTSEPTADTSTADTSTTEAEPVLEVASEPVPEVVPEAVSEAVLESVPEVVPEAVSEAVPESVSEAVSEVVSEAVPESVPEAAPETAPETAPAVALEQVSAEAIAPPPSEPIPAAPLPFWAQAEAERQERLERLKAEAIREPEPEPEPQPTTDLETLPEIPDFVLDEAFVWSAEVLAGQGRRPDQVSLEEITWLKRLRQGLDKTRRNLVNQLRAIVGQGPLNQDAVMEIESLLLQADVGIEATDFIVESLQNRLRQEALPPAEAIAYLKQLLREMLDEPLGGSHSLTFVPEKDRLNIWLVTGVNGAGKTTTIGKIAHIAQKSGYRCLIAAADTFRAAAVQQVKVWGDRSQVEVIANPGQNTDPAAVVFDAITAAQSRNTELLIVDTAGRLQNKKNLMDELSKIRRIIDKKAPNAHVESLLVLDSTLGQNGLRQAEVFSEVAKLSGVVLTKLDGTAKGGIALAVVKQLGLPIRFIGAGEGIEDLRPFSSYEFVEALLNG
ncbi:MAG: signal recognition particle-docking protein FtsY [Oculatellaceae cyanobacterium Prado106]|jgi:fused signal recognition particle receptor|nr:signal recognition particle-docking protein FtsY [Oculatellaceae cyanobacterium Prado106]